MQDHAHYLVQSLRDDGLIAESDLAHAERRGASDGTSVLEALQQLGVISSERLAIARAKLCDFPFADVGAFSVDLQNARLMPRELAEAINAFPLFCIDDIATVGMEDPLDLTALDRLRKVLRRDVDPVVCDPERLRALIKQAYGIVIAEGVEVAEEEELTTGDEPIVAAVNQILHQGMESGASDVHLSPDDRALYLRYRVDGSLVQRPAPDVSAHAGLVQRLKVMAKLDLTQTRKPQDGKFRFMHSGRPIDVRLSVIPTIHGENVVMRLLRQGTAIGSIDELDMPDAVRRGFEAAVRQPLGLLLVTGPTGSGKTTTLYTALARLNTPDRNVVTIEDPVEIRLPMVRHIQAAPELGVTFASALRAVLRQDPDVVLVGEIRDEETARIAVQAAMTGHLVLSTLHTNDAVSAVTRLRDIGIPPYAINGSLLGVLGQRLVRRVCSFCAHPVQKSQEDVCRLGLEPEFAGTYSTGAGCPKCSNTGYKGRVGVYEMVLPSPELRKLIEENANTQTIYNAAGELGYEPLWVDALAKARAGITSLEEAARLRSSMGGSALRVTPERAAA
ncbi:MAG: ATPase, T2SS/T4P/T4SS family [Planctomycetota bacterium]